VGDCGVSPLSVLLGTALLAYSFGLRHAVDADHIAAIDNVTRKLMQEGKRPVGVGFMFSLGHSTIVVLGSAWPSPQPRLCAAASHRCAHNVGGVIGTLVSPCSCSALQAVNLVVLRSIYRALCACADGEPYVEEDFDLLLASRGFLPGCSGHVRHDPAQLAHVSAGLLFGLGFDTATEIGLLGISAAEASKGLPIWSIMVFPALFAAGMSLIDTTDNMLMLGAYGWAFVKPIRKLYYNITITFVSVVVALVVGGIEALGLLAGQFSLNGTFWSTVRALNDNFGALG
jgi:nickel/cobalt transporter (NiCoT) family protein